MKTDSRETGYVDRKLALSFGAMVLLLMLITTGLASFMFAKLNTREESRLSGIIAAILSESVTRISFSGKYQTRLMLEEIRSIIPKELAYISVEDKEGRVIAHSDPSMDDTVMTEKQDAALRMQCLHSGELLTGRQIVGEKIIREVVLPFRNGPDNEVAGIVRIGIRTDEARQEQRASILRLFLLVSLLTVTAMWIVLIVSRHFGARVQMLANQLQGILNHAPIAICVSDKTGRMLADSAVCEQLFGQPKAGESLTALLEKQLSASDVQRLTDADRQIFNTGVKKEEDMELEIQGRFCAWHVSKFPISLDKNGSPMLICTFIHDITQRKQAEKALRSSLVFAEKLIEAIPDPVFYKDTRGVYQGCNVAYARMLGIAPHDIVGKSVYDVAPREQADKYHDMDLTLFAAPGFQTYESAFISADGSLRDVIFRKSTFLDHQGNVAGLIGIMIDITEHKRAEAEKSKLEDRLRQAQKMEAIGTLAGGIAHDFNNILGAIFGYAEMILEDIPEQDPFHQNIVQILRAAYRARDLVRQILTFSRMQTGQTAEKVNVTQILREAVRFLRASLPSTIEIRQSVAHDAISTLADPTQIHEILINLCTNAAHAMEEKGGVLDIRLTDNHPDTEVRTLNPDAAAGRYLRLTVTDTGHGMSPDIMEHIFDPYFTTKGVGKGTGLGLAVVHGLVARYGGAITVHSDVGNGTTFHVYLPAIENADTPEPETKKNIPRGSERVLFVDDEEMLTIMMKLMLEQLGYRVQISVSSTMALEMFRANPSEFDLVISDFTMPGMTGMDMAAALLQIRPDIPIILCTGFSEQIDEDKAAEAGIRAFLMKPVSIGDMARVIRQVLC